MSGGGRHESRVLEAAGRNRPDNFPRDRREPRMAIPSAGPERQRDPGPAPA